MTEKCYSFAIGDVVKPKNKTWCRPTANGSYIITDYCEGEYAINGSAWFEFKNFELVHRANKVSLRSARILAQDDEE